MKFMRCMCYIHKFSPKIVVLYQTEQLKILALCNGNLNYLLQLGLTILSKQTLELQLQE